MNKAVFLDRDGVINNPKENYYVYKPEDFIFNASVFLRLKEYIKEGYLLIIISNQGGISKGLYTKKDVENVHNKMLLAFKEHEITISGIYFCPHHNSIENCLCRKPSGLMLEKAIACFHISKNKSVMIGDSIRDISAANQAGIKGILIPKNTYLPSVSAIQETISTDCNAF